jgi:hypothetical protein
VVRIRHVEQPGGARQQVDAIVGAAPWVAE